MKKYLSLLSHNYPLPQTLKRAKGFTLIELLIVIVIIGILSTLLTANFVGVRQRARDAQRKSDIRQIQAALELYRADNSAYPIQQSSLRINSTVCPTSSAFSLNGTVYMTKVPCDPLGSSAYNTGNYYYYSDGTGTSYILSTCLENANDKDSYTTASSPSPSGGTCTSGKFYQVTNP